MVPLSGSTIWSVTLVPAGPLILAVATELDWPAIDLPSTSVTKSPFLMPAFLAGEPSNTLITRRPRRSWSTLMPTPSNRPWTDSWNCLVSFGVR